MFLWSNLPGTIQYSNSASGFDRMYFGMFMMLSMIGQNEYFLPPNDMDLHHRC